MNKQQMEQIIYEEFVNNIYENAKFDLSEEKSRMIEEFMNQIFKEGSAPRTEDEKLTDEEIAALSRGLGDPDYLKKLGVPQYEEMTYDELIKLKRDYDRNTGGMRNDLNDKMEADLKAAIKKAWHREAPQRAAAGTAAYKASQANNQGDKPKGDDGPATAGTKASQDFDGDTGEPITFAGLQKCSKDTRCDRTHLQNGPHFDGKTREPLSDIAKKICAKDPACGKWHERLKDGDAGEKEPEAAADIAKDPEDKKDAEETTKQVIYVIQQAAPQSYFRKHGIIGGILKKTFELAFGTDVWRDPADARYFLNGIYQNPYNAPMMAVQFLQQNREQILAAAGDDPRVTQVANQIATAGKKAAAKTEADPEKEKLDATEKNRTDVDDVLPGDGEEKPEEAPGEETEEPGEETPGEEEAKALVPKDDIPWNDRFKQLASKWERFNLKDVPPGPDRVKLAQQTLLPDLLKRAIDTQAETGLSAKPSAQALEEALPFSSQSKIDKAMAAMDAEDDDKARMDWDDEQKQKKAKAKFEKLKADLLKGDLLDVVDNANLASLKSDGLFGSVLNYVMNHPNGPTQLRTMFVTTSPEAFGRALVHMRDAEITALGSKLGSMHKDALRQYVEKERAALEGSTGEKKGKSLKDLADQTPKAAEPRKVAEGMKALMERRKSRILSTPKTGSSLLKWVLEQVAALLGKGKGKKSTAADTRRKKSARPQARARRNVMKKQGMREIKKSSLTQENIAKAVTKWHANKGITLQEGKAKKIAESILKVIK